jgi:hypothetical protein
VGFVDPDARGAFRNRSGAQECRVRRDDPTVATEEAQADGRVESGFDANVERNVGRALVTLSRVSLRAAYGGGVPLVSVVLTALVSRAWATGANTQAMRLIEIICTRAMCEHGCKRHAPCCAAKFARRDAERPVFGCELGRVECVLLTAPTFA